MIGLLAHNFRRKHLATQRISPIWILIFAAIGPLGCGGGEHPPQFRLLGHEVTGLDFSNELTEDDSFNIIRYLYYYNGGGVAVGDVNNDGWPDLYVSANRMPNKLFLNKGMGETGHVQFQDVTDIAGVAGSGNWSTGVNVADVNGDGWLDIYLCTVGGYKSFRGKNQLFINQGCDQDTAHDVPCAVTFREMAGAYGLDHEGFSTQSAFFDYDRDGDLDMYLLNHSVHSSESYRDTSTTRMRDPRAGDKLFENRLNEVEQNSKFVDVSEKAGIIGGVAGYGLGIAISDLDQNGYPDIYVANDFHENDFVYLNTGHGSFTESGTRSIERTSYFSMGADIADLNNDALPDIMTLDMRPDDEILYKRAQGPDSYDIYRFKRSFGYHDQLPWNTLQINRGAGLEQVPVFGEIAQILGVAATDWSWSVLMADFDLDGWKDIHITNGIVRRPNDLDYLKYIADAEIQDQASDLQLASKMPSGKVSNVIFRNRPGQAFDDVTASWGLSRPSLSNGAAYADFDLDGDLDLVVNNINQQLFYYENQASGHDSLNYLSVSFDGPAGNPFGVGVTAVLYHDDRRQWQELFPVRGWQSSCGYYLHFGLGRSSTVDSLEVRWPNGKIQRMLNVHANQHLKINFAEASDPPSHRSLQLKSGFKRHGKLLPFTHEENAFFDNNREPLIPYLLSTQGPRVAVSDINGDGLEDCFIGGATGQSGALLIQDSAGHFRRSSDDFAADSLSEDVGLAFFDADGDGDADLYIGSAGNQYYHQDIHLRDRLYVNDGLGKFTKSEDALPPFYGQTSCVQVADVDRDGDLDLFVGTRCIAVNYGKRADSYLLLNNGGHFSPAPASYIDLRRLGMVADAQWSDIDGDLDPDLLVIGDWMEPTLFENAGDRFIKRKLFTQPAFGWWNTCEVADLDGDGDEDFVLGNFGLNSILRPSVTEPIQLYRSDFDGNLSSDPILSHFKQGKEYPLAGLDMLASQLVYLKKEHSSYGQFAERTLSEIFPSAKLRQAERHEVNNFRSLIAVNNGDGLFDVQELPQEAQVAPVFAIQVHDFDGDNHLDILLAGNLYETQPLIGRMDASTGTLLLGNDGGSFASTDPTSLGLSLRGQIRDLQMIKYKDTTALLVARNKDTALLIAVTR